MESSNDLATASASGEVSVSYASVKLPAFSVSEPLTWFRRAEVQFRLKGIKRAETKADFVLEALPDSVFRRISPWLEEQAEEIAYDNLKSYILGKFTLSSSERARKVLDLMKEPLGDRSPREVWDEMQSLLRLTSTDPATGKTLRLDMERHIWLLTLPHSIRSLLDDVENMKMEDLVSKAEALVIASRASDHKTFNKPMSTCEVTCTSEETAIVETNACQRPSRYFKKNTNRPKGYITISGLCNYHKKYGKNAWSCVDGCCWYEKNELRGRQQ